MKKEIQTVPNASDSSIQETSNAIQLDKHDVLILEANRPKIELFLAQGTCRNLNFDPLIDIYKRYCDPDFPRLRYYEIGHSELDMIQKAMKGLYRFFDDWKLNNNK